MEKVEDQTPEETALEHVVLITEEFLNEDGTKDTIGTLYVKNEQGQMEPFCKSIERPWQNNKAYVSCIPAGMYKVTWNYSPAFKRDMYLLLETQPRSGIRIHPANLATELHGCIAFGDAINKVKGKAFLSNSGATVKEFEKRMGYKDFYITVEGRHRLIEEENNG